MNKVKIVLNNFLVVVSVMILGSCHHKVDWEHPDFEPKPTINSFLVEGSPIRAHVSLAVDYGPEESPVVDNAQVNLYIDGSHAETLTHDEDGFYQSSLVAEAGREYRCEVAIPGYPPAVATTSIPMPQTIVDVEHINNAGVDEEGVTYPALKVTFTNSSNKATYYHLAILLMQRDYHSYINPFYINDPVLLNEGLPITVFSNQAIEGDSYTMTINYTTGSASSINGSGWVTNLYPLIVELRTVTEHYYQYAKTLHLYETANDDPFFTGNSILPFNIHSNVENGYGIFAGYSKVATDTIYP